MQVILQADQRPEQNHKDELLPAYPQKLYLLGERNWTDVELQKYSLSDYSVSKKLINLLRHGSLLREDDGAIESCRIKDHLQSHFVFCHHRSDEQWKSSVHCPEECSRVKMVENCRYTVVPTLRRLELFFAQLLM